MSIKLALLYTLFSLGGQGVIITQELILQLVDQIVAYKIMRLLEEEVVKLGQVVVSEAYNRGQEIDPGNFDLFSFSIDLMAKR